MTPINENTPAQRGNAGGGNENHEGAGLSSSIPLSTDRIAAQLRRRRQASLRCEPLTDGRRDPWSRRDPGADHHDEQLNLDSWGRALAHLRDVGLTGLPPRDVRRALARRSAA